MKPKVKVKWNKKKSSIILKAGVKKKKKSRWNKQKTTRYIVDFRPTITLITLNVNYLNK